MESILLTIWCVLTAIGSLYLFGLPLTAWLADQTEDLEGIWVTAPFIGLAALILILQNLVYLNATIRVSTPWIWIAGIALWVISARRLRSILTSSPRPLLLAACAVYLVQGLGLFVIGVQYYVGRALIDQFNYTATAQHFVDYPFSLTYGGLSDQPYLITAINLKFDRIGVSIFQGFLAANTFTDAKTVFEPAILLAPSLVVFAVYALAHRISLVPRLSAFAAVGAGLLPALSLVHIETFFSQALGIPFLFFWIVSLDEWMNRPTWKQMFAAAIILAGATTIYSEFYPILLGVALVALAASVKLHPQERIRYLASFPLLIAIALGLNIGALASIYTIIGRVNYPSILANIYPWAYSMEGLGQFWIGDAVFFFQSNSWLRLSYSLLAPVLFIAAYIGLASIWWRRRDGVSLLVFALAVLPWIVRVFGQYPYQFFKLLFSIGPLLLLGIAAILGSVKPGSSRIKLPPRFIGVVTFGLLLVFCAGTISTTLVAGVYPIVGRSIGAMWLLGSGARQVQDHLADIRGSNILIASDNNFLNAWLAYFARHNRVWLTNPRMSDINIQGMQNWNDFPDNLNVITISSDQRTLDGSAQLLWSAEPYQIWHVQSRDGLVLLNIQNKNGLEDWGGERGFWLGDGDTGLEIVSRGDQPIVLTADFKLGPSLPDSTDRRILLLTEGGSSSVFTILRNGIQALSIPVVKGTNHIVLRPLDKATAIGLPNGDMRPLILGMSGLRLWASSP